MSSLRRAASILLLVVATSSVLAACDTDDGRALREPPPGATAPPMPTSTSTTAAVANPPAGSDEVAALVLTSSAFVEGTAIPVRHASCDGGDDVSPAIAWTGVPAGTVELALTMVDPDAPDGPFVHWVLVGIDPTVTGLGEGGVPETVVEIQPWTGPCPPEGETHSYVFTVYALNEPSGLAVGTDPSAALPDLEGGAIARGQLTGTYGRPSS